MHQLTGPEDARRTVEYWAFEGVTSFKAYMFVTRAELQAAIDAAHAHGIRVTGHLCSVGFTEAADLGIDDLEHGLLVDTEFTPGKKPDVCPPAGPARDALVKLDEKGPEIQGLIRHLVAKHVAFTSTLPRFEPSCRAGRPRPAVLAAMLPEARQEYLDRREKVAAAKDSPWPGLFAKEMAFEHDFAQPAAFSWRASTRPATAASSPATAISARPRSGRLRAARRRPAERRGFLGDDEVVLAPGKAADLDVVAGDPSTNIARPRDFLASGEHRSIQPTRAAGTVGPR